MQLTSHLITAAGLAVATTNAFLVPLEIPIPEHDTISTLPVSDKSDAGIPKIAEEQTVKLNCPGCPMRVAHHGLDGDAKITTEIPTHLELDFSIETFGDFDHLMLNGYELYPHADPFRNTLSARLVPDMKKKKHHPGPKSKFGKGPKKGDKGHPEPAIGRPTAVEPLGFGLRTSHVETSPDDALELVMVEIQIIEVGSAFVDGISNVQVKLIKTPENQLMIGNIETADSETIQETPMDKQEECTTVLCKWRAEFMAQISRMRHHCPGHRGHGAHPHHHGFDGHHKPPHNLLGDSEHTHSWGQLFKNIGAHILLPIAIGIMAGVTASIFGMMVGTFIVMLWRSVFRRNGGRRSCRRGHQHKAAARERAAGEEKAGLMANQEPEAPPAYVEEGLVSTTDNKEEA